MLAGKSLGSTHTVLPTCSCSVSAPSARASWTPATRLGQTGCVELQGVSGDTGPSSTVRKTPGVTDCDARQSWCAVAWRAPHSLRTTGTPSTPHQAPQLANAAHASQGAHRPLPTFMENLKEMSRQCAERARATQASCRERRSAQWAFPVESQDKAATRTRARSGSSARNLANSRYNTHYHSLLIAT